MKILLTGAQGFTGQHLAAHLQALGHEICELGADLLDASAVQEQVLQAAPQAVVHLAAISFVGHASARAFYDVNIIGTMHLLDALCSLAQRPDKVLLASSANVYGNCPHSPINESQVPAPVNHYAASKLGMEAMAATYLPRLNITITRPFNYTGAGQSADFLVPKIVAHIARQAQVIELGNLHVEREFNDVRTLCDAYTKLLLSTSGASGEIYNVCSGHGHSLQTVLDTLQRLSGWNMQVVVNPAFVRQNEVHRLVGNPQKLYAQIGQTEQYSLEQTLAWMLQAAQKPGS